MKFYEDYNNENDKCLYFDENNTKWSQAGCKKGKSLTNESVTCLCNHLTLFTFGNLDLTGKIRKYGLKEFTRVTFELPGFIFPVILLIAFIIAMLRARFSKQQIKINPDIRGVHSISHQKHNIIDNYDLEDEENYTEEGKTSGRLSHKLTTSPAELTLNSEFKPYDKIVKEPKNLYHNKNVH